ncbi:hypothetical protein FOZ61_003087 [Perkinsus olseni]|uniref:PIH1 N-terminal domain-containing protein n=1 Tax=Perkinsus olseni TaxID=32597 RepID=A0A7J6LR22_PEROL|nr:hypothetical protein FOZ61_003087 [Perkinsus olseni]KAF4667024.1 hypothetical protein FOL46_002746 [Perkinsus olseni]
MFGGVDVRYGGSSQSREDDLLLRRDDQGVTVRPDPGLVVKTRDTKTREKIFVNLTSSEYVEAPHVKSFLDNSEQQQGIRVPMSIGEKREDADRKGGRCVVIDVVFNPEVLKKAMEAADGGEYKKSICQLALSGVGRKYGMDSLDVDNFVTPRMRYKGSTIPQQRIRVKRESAIAEVPTAGPEAAASPHDEYPRSKVDLDEQLPMPQFTIFYRNTYSGVYFDGFDLSIYRSGRKSVRENLRRRLFKRGDDEEDTYELPLSVLEGGVADSDASSFTGSLGGSSMAVPVDDPLQPLRGSVCEIRVTLTGVLTASHIEVEASDECVRIRHNPPFSGHRKYRTLISWFPTRFAGGVQKCEFDGEVLKIDIAVDKLQPDTILECDTEEEEEGALEVPTGAALLD